MVLKTSYVEATCLAKSTSPNIDDQSTTYPGPGVYAKFSPGNEYRIDQPGKINEKGINKEKNSIVASRGIDATVSLVDSFTETTIEEGTNVTIKITCERPEAQITYTTNPENKNKFSELNITRTANKTYNTGANLQANLQLMVNDQFVNSQNFFPF